MTTKDIILELAYCKNLNRKPEKELLENAVELMKQLQAENEKWQGGYMTQKQEIANLEVELKAMRGAANSYKAENKRLSTLAELGNTRANDYRVMRDRALKAEAENERLKAEVKFSDYLEYETTNQIKAEAYKEFAKMAIDRVEKAKAKYQRLCKEQGEEMEEHMHIHFNGITKIINNLLKEKVGEDNA